MTRGAALAMLLLPALARAYARRAPSRVRMSAEAPPSAGTINWYPGHIAKAERQLRDYLKRVDVVVEARDARIAATTAHPSLADWVGPRRPARFLRKTKSLDGPHRSTAGARAWSSTPSRTSPRGRRWRTRRVRRARATRDGAPSCVRDRSLLGAARG